MIYLFILGREHGIGAEGEAEGERNPSRHCAQQGLINAGLDVTTLRSDQS